MVTAWTGDDQAASAIAACPAAQRVENPDNRHQCGIFEQPDKGVHDSRNYMGQGLRQSYQGAWTASSDSPIACAPSYWPLSMACRPPADDLCHVGSREQHHPGQAHAARLSKLTPSGRKSGNITEAMNSTVISAAHRARTR